MISCSIDNLYENFPELRDKGYRIVIDSSETNVGKLTEWVERTNRAVLGDGFREGVLYSLDRKENTMATGHNFHRNNKANRLIFTINKDLVDSYDQYVIEEYFAQVELEKIYRQQVFEEDMKSEQEISDEALEWQDTLRDKLDESYDEGMYSSYEALEPERPTSNVPVDFSEWGREREEVLKRLNESKKRALKRNNRSEVKELNDNIRAIERELTDFDSSNVHRVLNSAWEEVNTLKSIIKENIENPVRLAALLTSNDIMYRVDLLERAFTENKSEDPTMFNQVLAHIPEYKDISYEVEQIKSAYSSNLGKIVKSLILNNQYTRDLEDRFTQEGRVAAWQKFLNKVDELTDPKTGGIDGDKLSSIFLGAGSYNHILGDILAVVRETAKNAEAGQNLLWRKMLQNAYDKMVNRHSPSFPILDLIYKKDQFGSPTNVLISPYHDDFFKNIYIAGGFQREFMFAPVKDKAGHYEYWMQYEKDNFDYIDVRFIQRFAEKHKNTTIFKEFLTATEDEMQAYEDEMISKMGETAFEVALIEQIDRIENFLGEEFTSTAEVDQYNPLAFLQHFYSDDYGAFNSKLGVYSVPHRHYIRAIPKTDVAENYNPDFRMIEDVAIKDGFKDFYVAATQILGYVRDAGQSAGLSIKFNEIISLEDAMGRAAIEELSGTGKIGLSTMEMIRKTFRAPFYEGTHENPNKDRTYKIHEDRKFNSQYSMYGSREMKAIAEHLSMQSVEELVSKAEEQGMIIPANYFNVPDELSAKEAAIYENKLKSILAEGIARSVINKSSSLDALQRITYAANIAESINTRLAQDAILTILKDYAKKESMDVVGNFLSVQEGLNVKKVGTALHTTGRWQDLEKSKIERVGVGKLSAKTKVLNEAEKALRKMFKEEQSNLQEDYNFELDGIKYKKVGDSYFAGTEEIPLSEIQDKYETYLQDKIDELGKHPTWGTVINGLAFNMYRMHLHFAPWSGFNNRLQGYNQNNQGAASRAYGYDSEDLWSAREFMVGIGAAKLANYIPGVKNLTGSFGPVSRHKKQQWGIMMHLAENLGMLDIVMQDIRGGDGSKMGLTSENFRANLNEFASDFAMNIPEIHNQMELMLAMMMNVKIEKYDTDGVTIIPDGGALFDSKTNTFPFDPTTMELTPDYATPNNIKNWQEFTQNADGKKPQDIFTQKFKSVRNKLHGNYSADNKIKAQAMMWSRGLTVFMKWAYENANNQYGFKEIDLLTGEVNVRGRKIVLAQHTPTFAAHLLLNNIGIGTMAGATAAIFKSDVGLASLGLDMFARSSVLIGLGSSVLGIGLIAYQIRKNNLSLSTQKADLSLALSYVGEVAVRSLKTSIAGTESMFVGLFNKKGIARTMLSDKKIAKWFGLDNRNKWESAGIPFEDRQRISESAQELADKFNIYFKSILAQLALKGLLILISNADGDEKKLRDIDRRMNKIINLRNQVTSEIEMWTDPVALKDMYSTAVLVETVWRSGQRAVKAYEQYQTGKISGYQGTLRVTQALTGPTLGAPSNLFKLADYETDFFSDERVYEPNSYTIADFMIESSLKVGDAKYDRLTQHRRDLTRAAMKNHYENRLKKENMAPSKIDDLVEKNIQKNFRRNGAYKNKRNPNAKTNLDILKNADWDKMIEQAKTGPIYE